MPAIKRTIGLFLLLGLLLFGAGAWAASAQSSTEDQLQLGAQLLLSIAQPATAQMARGRVGATLAKDWPSVRPDLTVKNTIINGIPGSPMPAWSNTNGGPLDATQIDALTAYILSWQTGGAANIIIVPTPTPLPPVTPIPNITGDTVNGAALFQVNCIMCHGEGGQGKIGRTLAKQWAGVRPDLTIQNTIRRGITNTSMPAWGQAFGGPLSDQEINDLTAYILAMPRVIQVQSPTEPPQPAEDTWLSGWGGILVFVVLLAVLLTFGVLIQRRK